jgi:hypothetical protein
MSFILTLLLLPPFTGNLHAKNPGEYMILIGFNGAKWIPGDIIPKGNISDAFRYIPGITIGLSRRFPLGPQYHIEPGICFTTKGTRMHTIGELYLHHVLACMEIPLLAGWALNPQHNLQVCLEAGIVPAIRLIAFNEVGFLDETRTLDTGITAGAGIRIHRLSVRIRLNRGCMDVNRNEGGGTYRNQTLSLILELSLSP